MTVGIYRIRMFYFVVILSNPRSDADSNNNCPQNFYPLDRRFPRHRDEIVVSDDSEYSLGKPNRTTLVQFYRFAGNKKQSSQRGVDQALWYPKANSRTDCLKFSSKFKKHYENVATFKCQINWKTANRAFVTTCWGNYLKKEVLNSFIYHMYEYTNIWKTRFTVSIYVYLLPIDIKWKP